MIENFQEHELRHYFEAGGWSPGGVAIVGTWWKRHDPQHDPGDVVQVVGTDIVQRGPEDVVAVLLARSATFGAVPAEWEDGVAKFLPAEFADEYAPATAADAARAAKAEPDNRAARYADGSPWTRS